VESLTRKHEALVFLNDETIADDAKKAAVMKQNEGGLTALIKAIHCHVDHSIIKRMVEIGGKDLVILTDKDGKNVLINAAIFGSSNDIIKTIMDAGGKDLILQKDFLKGNTAMHYACAWGVSIETIKHMIEVGGQEALMKKNNLAQVPHSNDTTLQEYLSEMGGG
jgi:hypothetical protein